jgi:UDP-2,3-diacylglucosamine pyrophosphatase LpxH
MKWIVFSDTHLGSAVSHREKDLYTLIKDKASFVDKIVINGDFMDLWRTSLSKIMKNEDNLKLINLLFRQLPLQGIEVFYIFGNHEDMDKDALRLMFPQVKFVELLVMQNIVMTHGHRFDDDVVGKKRLRAISIVKLRQFIESIIRIDLRKFVIMLDRLLHLGIAKKFVDEIHDKVIAKYSTLYEAAIIGHTHIHEQKRITNSFLGSHHFTLYDTGNTYDDLNYYIFDDSTLIETGA